MKYLVILGAVLNLSSCNFLRQESSETYGASIGIVNHTDKYIYSIQVGDGGGGHAARYSAGMANVCCVTLPVKWYEGLQFNVKWDMPEGSKHIWKEKEVKVEEYERPGSLYLHFFPNDEVRIVVTNWVGSAPEHPIPRPVKPAAQR